MAPIIEMQEGATLDILGKSLIGDGTKILIGPGGAVSIGDGTFFDGDPRVICFRSVTIGARCAIAWEVTIMDARWHPHRDGATGDRATPNPFLVKTGRLARLGPLGAQAPSKPWISACMHSLRSST